MNKRKFTSLLVSGGAGFIGSNFIRHLLRKTDFKGSLINVDSLTYAGNPDNLRDFEKEQTEGRYVFENADIRDYEKIYRIMEKYRVDGVVHFAAETHVDRSIHDPRVFVQTNIVGTFNLLEVVRTIWKERSETLFHHVSTDEVFGSLESGAFFSEETAYHPRSPYSASKAASDHLARAYYHTYRIPVTISNCSNNYGPYQFPEKLIPLIILNACDEKELPVYGDGKHVRDWLFVTDHCEAICKIIFEGTAGETYNIGSGEQRQNIEVVQLICDILDRLQPRANGAPHRELITFMKDRPGHDRRYAIKFDKMVNNLHWQPRTKLQEGLEHTINWYLRNGSWIQRIKSGEYSRWLDVNYRR